MIRVKDAPVSDQQLIYFASELEFAAGHLNDCVEFAMGKSIVEARDVLNSATIVFKEVLEGYKKTFGHSLKLASKGDELITYSEKVLSLCSAKLRESLTILPQ